jgi:hypothetical protein
VIPHFDCQPVMCPAVSQKIPSLHFSDLTVINTAGGTVSKLAGNSMWTPLFAFTVDTVRSSNGKPSSFETGGFWFPTHVVHPVAVVRRFHQHVADDGLVDPS